MKKYLTVLAAFVVMLCIGSVYAWSIVAAELMTGYGHCATVFGVANLGLVYPYVFLGYAIAGIAGPFSGGYLYDLSGNFSAAIYLAALMSLAGSLLFLISYIRKKRRQAAAEAQHALRA